MLLYNTHACIRNCYLTADNVLSQLGHKQNVTAKNYIAEIGQDHSYFPNCKSHLDKPHSTSLQWHCINIGNWCIFSFSAVTEMQSRAITTIVLDAGDHEKVEAHVYAKLPKKS